MRIGLFTDLYPPFINGVSTSVAMLEKGLREKGHDVFIVTVNPENFSYKLDNEDRVLKIPGLPTGFYDYRLSGIYPVRSLKKIKEWNLDLIHVHTEFGIGTFARLVAEQYNIPIVYTYHTMWEDYTHYITKGYFDKTSKKIVEELTKFFCGNSVKEIIVPSKKAHNLLQEKYKVNHKVTIIPTGIEVERFFKEKFDKKEIQELKDDLKIKKDDFVILYLGRLAEEKNVELLLSSHKQILKKNKKAKLVIVGSGPDYGKFIDTTLKLGLKKNVIFTGAIPWDEVPKYYQLADVFATASTSETQGLTIIEAMAASLPVVCSNDPSFNSIVIDDINGYLFNKDKEYIDKVNNLMKNKKQLSNMSIEARITSENHSIQKYAENVLKVYRRCLRKSNEEKNKKWYQKLKDKIRGEE